jgi:hypothetical protein
MPDGSVTADQEIVKGTVTLAALGGEINVGAAGVPGGGGGGGGGALGVQPDSVALAELAEPSDTVITQLAEEKPVVSMRKPPDESAEPVAFPLSMTTVEAGVAVPSTRSWPPFSSALLIWTAAWATPGAITDSPNAMETTIATLAGFIVGPPSCRDLNLFTNYGRFSEGIARMAVLRPLANAAPSSPLNQSLSSPRQAAHSDQAGCGASLRLIRSTLT